MATETDGTGLKWRGRASGKRAPYWIARADLIKVGFLPKSVKLDGDEHDVADRKRLAAECAVLQATMLEWSSSYRASKPAFDGSIQSLIECAEADPESFYAELSHGTRKHYHKVMRLLMSTVGDRQIEDLSGADTFRWYKNIRDVGDEPRTNYAYLMISILKSYISYGAANDKVYPGCLALRQQMAAVKFRNGQRRKVRMTYGQLVAFREAAHAEGPASDWIALCVTLQFECAFRRRDVIGEYVWTKDGKRWRDGLTWSCIDDDGVLRKLISKTKYTTEYESVHRIAHYPDLVTELDRIPADQRIWPLGPLVIHPGTNLPPTEVQCRYAFRRIARKAGIPDTVQNKDARAGAVTESYEAGAKPADTMALATHTQMSTSQLYNRETLEQTSRVATLRVDSRKREP